MLDAVVACEELEICLPRTNDELDEMRMGWSNISSGKGLLFGFIGAIDGWLVPIEMPRNTPNQGDYFSGHYQRMGLNIQAICDSKLRFIYFTVSAPGKTGDARAFSRLEKLSEWIDTLPEGLFVGGDNAYPLSSRLLCPYSGHERFEEFKRTFNYFFSQLRIRIEMAFGRMSTKWRVVRQALNCDLEKNILICEAAARLHNFVIDQDDVRTPNCPDIDYSMLGDPEYQMIRNFSSIDQVDGGPLGFLPNIPDNFPGIENMTRREAILEVIKRINITTNRLKSSLLLIF
mmetsp:Transcript_14261/g.34632  ORF Transcript_14261/g.34632 Transcript_14261/m.34632 type:complete len:288 (-) Transcript_14261:90-953(-)